MYQACVSLRVRNSLCVWIFFSVFCNMKRPRQNSFGLCVRPVSFRKTILWVNDDVTAHIQKNNNNNQQSPPFGYWKSDAPTHDSNVTGDYERGTNNSGGYDSRVMLGMRLRGVSRQKYDIGRDWIEIKTSLGRRFLKRIADGVETAFHLGHEQILLATFLHVYTYMYFDDAYGVSDNANKNAGSRWISCDDECAMECIGVAYCNKRTHARGQWFWMNWPHFRVVEEYLVYLGLIYN